MLYWVGWLQLKATASAQVALGENGEWQKCLSIFHTATAHDAVGYNACMSACEKSSQWQAALRLFADMLEMKLVDSVPQPFRQLEVVSGLTYANLFLIPAKLVGTHPSQLKPCLG